MKSNRIARLTFFLPLRLEVWKLLFLKFQFPLFLHSWHFLLSTSSYLLAVIFLKNGHFLTEVAGKILGLKKKRKRKKCILASECKLQGQEEN